MPRIFVTDKEPQKLPVDICIIPVDSTLAIDTDLTSLAKKVEFTGEWGRAELFVAPHHMEKGSKWDGISFIALVGLGDTSLAPEKRAEGLRRAIASVIIDGRSHLIQNIAIVLPDVSLVSAATESVLLTDYWFSHHSRALKVQQKARSLSSVALCVTDSKDLAAGAAAIKRAERVMQGVDLTRDLVNQPASHMSPVVLVQEARKITKGSKDISLTVMNRAQAQKKKFFGFLAVARGSKEEPYVIHLTYKPKKKAKKTLVVIGKGITFDSGGLSLKPAQSMEDMKIDMAGAAAVLGLFSILPTLKPDIEIHGIIAACENMPSGHAYRPGDVITTMKGKTIEVLNTDAEGRITLADALLYAEGLKPDAMIDLATLTGACAVAVGDTHAGLFGNTEQLNEQLMNAARKSGEGLVEFPMPEEYRPTVQSRIADVRNTSAMKVGGAITAALFLQEFVGASTDTAKPIPWAHVDIAGPAHAEVPLIPYWQFGATGYGVRTLVQFIEAFSS